MKTSELIALGGTVIVLAAVSMAILNGNKTATIINSITTGFAKVIKAATQQK